MFDFIKKIFFSVYLYSTRFKNIVLRSLSYKFGQWIIRPMGTAVYEFKGCKFRLNPLKYIDKMIISGKGHDKDVEMEIKSQLSNGGILLDVGANIGYFSILAAKIKDVEVFAYEPSQKDLMKLYDHMLLNNVQNIRVFPFGLADKLCVQKLYHGPERNSGENSVVNVFDNGYSEAIFSPLDLSLPPDLYERVKVCKIDVEGYEVHVLNGMKEIIPHLKNCTFVVEITPKFLAKANNTAEEIYDFFSGFGYAPRLGLGQGWQYDEIFYKK